MNIEIHFKGLFLLVVAIGVQISSSVHATEESVRFIAEDRSELSGVLRTPVRPKAIALILQGSGKVGASGDVSGGFVGDHGFQGGSTKLSETLAEALNASGYVSLRYNKRGFYNPDPNAPLAPFPQLRSDAIAATKYLKSRFPKLPLYIVGFSEGALLAIHSASLVEATGIFLFSPPPESVNDWLNFQFVKWPTTVLSRVDQNQDGLLEQHEFRSQIGDSSFSLPLTASPVNPRGLDWSVLDNNQDGAVSLTAEVEPYYLSAILPSIMSLVTYPTYQSWYSELNLLPNPQSLLSKYDGLTWSYHGALDSQFDPKKSVLLAQSAKHAKAIRVFRDLGHCFSPYEGRLKEIKTSGPINKNVLTAFKRDLVRAVLSR